MYELVESLNSGDKNKDKSVAVTMVNINEDIFLPDETSIFSLSTNEINIFWPKYGQTVVAATKFWTNLCFAVAQNEFWIDIVLQLQNSLVSETARYNAHIWRHYIGWGLKIRIDNLDKDESACTWGNVAPRHAK